MTTLLDFVRGAMPYVEKPEDAEASLRRWAAAGLRLRVRVKAGDASGATARVVAAGWPDGLPRVVRRGKLAVGA